MKKTLKIIAMLLAVIMVVGILASCDKPQEAPAAAPPADGGQAAQNVVNTGLPGGEDVYKDPIKISVISISTAGIVNRMYQMALHDQAINYTNIFLDFKDAEYDPNKQITLIEEAITQGYDCILLECMDPVAVTDAIERAEAAGIPVIATNSAMPMGLYSLYVTGVDYSAGWKGGIELAKISGGEGTAIVLDCPAEAKPGARMGTGFEDYIKENTNIEILEVIPTENWSADNAQSAMRDMLTKYGPGEITMVYCSSGDIANGALNAIDASGRGGDGILLWGFMGYPMELNAIKEGKMTGTMFSDTYTQYAAIFYLALNHIQTGLTSVTGGYTQTPVLESPMFPVTIDNVDEVMAFSGWYMETEMNTR